ncbi:unnamed protein product [Prorocentrum cordatum]|uniref:EF-hand domain-containing protein n=1 Tax=Prorocentrum cordatum TaxID=2364126 RepID=A0ABN9QXB0_9DINO|nr:unnamed protein product [Polarella glacialis]
MLGITSPLVTVALALACRAQADLQLMQLSVHGPAGDAPAGQPQRGCRTSVAGEECFVEVQWAMQTGIAENPGWYAPLTSSSSFEDFQRHLHATARLSGVCPEPCAERAQSAGRPTQAPTPAPTLEGGKPCTCDAAGCGVFPYLDLDGDGCLFLGESEKVEQFKGRFDELDADGDGCMTQAECANSSLSEGLPSFPIAAPDECTYGYFFSEDTSVCQVCTTGETRRRRSEACTECPSGKDDLGDFDQCIGGVYLTGPIERGADNVFINKDEDESGVVLVVGDTITMSTRNPGHFERLVITGKVGFDDGARLSPEHEALLRTRGPFFVLDHGVNEGFGKFDAMVSSCSATNGMELSDSYPCGCGIEICEMGYKCDENCGENVNNTLLDSYAGTGFGTGGCCIGPPPAVMPTPVPTVAARGDPHLVNLQGEHFDVNHGGEFILLRIPQNAAVPAEVELKATILPEHGKPCTTYITEVEISGSWLKGKVVQVRSYLRSRAQNTTDKFLGLRVLSDGAPAEAPWEKIDQWTDQAHVLAGPAAADTAVVTLSKAQWYSRKPARAGAPSVAGQVEVRLQATPTHEPAVLVVRQDLPGQEHLNLALRRLSALGRADVGGLLGFDAHPESLESVTPECQRHRDGLDPARRGPLFDKPGWKTRWEKVREARGAARRPGGKMEDNEAAATLAARAQMCVCPTEDLADGESAEGGRTEGVLADFQVGRLAEATWD